MKKPRSLFSLSPEHKQMLRTLAGEGHRSMTAELERIIEGEYNAEYRKYLQNPEANDPRN